MDAGGSAGGSFRADSPPPPPERRLAALLKAATAAFGGDAERNHFVVVIEATLALELIQKVREVQCASHHLKMAEHVCGHSLSRTAWRASSRNLTSG